MLNTPLSLMEPLLALSFVISFAVTLVLTPHWIKAAKRVGLVGRDMNKYDKPEVAEMGGIAVLAGFLAGIFYYIGLSTFYFKQNGFIVYIFAAISSILIISIVGIIDDVLGWKIGLKQWQKPLLTLAAALPMSAINAGKSTMILPFIGAVDFGILYPLLIVPIGIAGASNGFNMLAGYNGLEAGMGIIITTALSYVAYTNGYPWVSVLGMCMVFSLLAFLRYNWYPAKVFPGDTLTYSVGALIACLAILGNMEKVAVLLFLPYYFEFILKLRSKLKAESFGKPKEDGSLELPYERIYGIEHLAIAFIKKIKNKAYERDVTLLILSIEVFIAIILLI